MVSKLPRNTTLLGAPGENNRNLVIVLSAVFGSLALFMVVSATVFVYRWQRNPKYHRRGISPVDDEEIERWRGRKETYTEAPNRTAPKTHKRQSSSVVIVSNPPGWTWSAEPSPFGTRNSGETALSPPPMVARAPNSRSGLTDGAILGADPFVPPIRRPSARLAKHSRNQSRKSSFSASIPERMSTDLPRHYRDDSKKSFQADPVSPPSSIFNGSPGTNEPLPTSDTGFCRLPSRPIDSLLSPLARPLPNPPLHQLDAIDAPSPPPPLPHPTQQPRARLPRRRIPRRSARDAIPLDARDGAHAAHGCVWGAAYLWAGVLWRDCGVWNDGVSERRGEDGE
ncbi:hypothetical protein V494_06631 [Pseudogymnoascus sp. VKM F-4513 (FW-928)]|nr:hypothetical protein V494_06631 [Pseudogymnoascus sp. VKM F-4513 (FW-928)]